MGKVYGVINVSKVYRITHTPKIINVKCYVENEEAEKKLQHFLSLAQLMRLHNSELFSFDVEVNLREVLRR
jgi:hypothetical protein